MCIAGTTVVAGSTGAVYPTVGVVGCISGATIVAGSTGTIYPSGGVVVYSIASIVRYSTTISVYSIKLPIIVYIPKLVQ